MYEYAYFCLQAVNRNIFELRHKEKTKRNEELTLFK